VGRPACHQVGFPLLRQVVSLLSILFACGCLLFLLFKKMRVQVGAAGRSTRRKTAHGHLWGSDGDDSDDEDMYEALKRGQRGRGGARSGAVSPSSNGAPSFGSGGKGSKIHVFLIVGVRTCMHVHLPQATLWAGTQLLALQTYADSPCQPRGRPLIRPARLG
jgi:hypothetical protein